MGKRRGHTTESFIKISSDKHKNKYDYSKVEYVNCSTKVCIICPHHGDFWQIARNHIFGQGCPKCGEIKSRENQKLTIYEIIDRSNKIHNFVYTYDRFTEYHGYETKIEIRCQKHGYFKQSVHNHINGYGCNDCAIETVRRSKFKRVMCYDLNHNLVKVYDSMLSTEEDGFNKTNVSACCRGVIKKHKGFIFKYE